jgi:hypothetical protein
MHDPTDPMGRLLFNVLAMVAEFEADLICADSWSDQLESGSAALADGYSVRRLMSPNSAIARIRTVGAATAALPVLSTTLPSRGVATSDTWTWAVSLPSRHRGTPIL